MSYDNSVSLLIEVKQVIDSAVSVAAGVHNVVRVETCALLVAAIQSYLN